MVVDAMNCKDGYKVGHKEQYPIGTELVYSNFTPRSTKHMLSNKNVDDNIVFFGLQYFMKWYLQESWGKFFAMDKETAVSKYKRRIRNYLGDMDFSHIGDLHDLGYLPIEIKALPEGSVIPAGIPMLTISNTLPEFFWLPNFFETILSCTLWKPCTSATTARKYRILLDKWCKATGGEESFTQFQGHDFSMRGMSGLQDAQMSGAGHLLSFVGSDTIPAIDFLEEYYLADSDKELIACSVPATEHSVMCMGGKTDELSTFRNLMKPDGIISIVSDTWDYWKVLTEYLPKLREEIMSRKGKVVIRPDSGDPASIICGMDPGGALPEDKGSVQLLWDIFGGKINEKGYKELDPHIGLIYGDSITLERANNICERLAKQGFASSNIVFGIGSYTYQYVTRDSLGFAMKATAGRVNGKTVEIFKDPKTDDGIKKSAKGFLKVHRGIEYTLEQQCESPAGGELIPVYKDGEILREYSLKEIRNNIKNL